MIMIMISLWDFEIKQRKEDRLFIDKLKKEVKVSLGFSSF